MTLSGEITSSLRRLEPRVADFRDRKFELEWWGYVALGISGFLGCLALNYFVKLVNEARLQDTLEGIGHKSSSSRSTQVRGLPIELELKTDRSQMENIAHRSESTNKRISLVFSRIDNVPATKSYSDATSKIHVINEKSNDRKKPFFLGSIYKNRNLDVNPTNIKGTAQLVCSSILNGIVEKILILKNNENIILT